LGDQAGGQIEQTEVDAGFLAVIAECVWIEVAVQRHADAGEQHLAAVPWRDGRFVLVDSLETKVGNETQKPTGGHQHCQDLARFLKGLIDDRSGLAAPVRLNQLFAQPSPTNANGVPPA